jgi:hypothetical protein
MDSPIDWQSALDSLKMSNYAILKNQRLIFERLEEVQKKIQIVGAKLDEQTIVKARTGLLHLVAGINSDVEEVKALEFQMARGIFCGLVNLDPKGTTTGITASIDNMILVRVSKN